MCIEDIDSFFFFFFHRELPPSSLPPLRSFTLSCAFIDQSFRLSTPAAAVFLKGILSHQFPAEAVRERIDEEEEVTTKKGSPRTTTTTKPVSLGHSSRFCSPPPLNGSSPTPYLFIT